MTAIAVVVAGPQRYFPLTASRDMLPIPWGIALQSCNFRPDVTGPTRATLIFGKF